MRADWVNQILYDERWTQIAHIAPADRAARLDEFRRRVVLQIVDLEIVGGAPLPATVLGFLKNGGDSAARAAAIRSLRAGWGWFARRNAYETDRARLYKAAAAALDLERKESWVTYHASGVAFKYKVNQLLAKLGIAEDDFDTAHDKRLAAVFAAELYQEEIVEKQQEILAELFPEIVARMERDAQE